MYSSEHFLSIFITDTHGSNPRHVKGPSEKPSEMVKLIRAREKVLKHQGGQVLHLSQTYAQIFCMISGAR